MTSLVEVIKHTHVHNKHRKLHRAIKVPSAIRQSVSPPDNGTFSRQVFFSSSRFAQSLAHTLGCANARFKNEAPGRRQWKKILGSLKAIYKFCLNLFPHYKLCRKRWAGVPLPALPQPATCSSRMRRTEWLLKPQIAAIFGRAKYMFVFPSKAGKHYYFFKICFWL